MLTAAQALHRANLTRASFPKGPITQAQARAMVVAMVDSQVGYASGNPNWSIYGEPESWRTDWKGRQVYWCLLFLSWAFEQTFGAEAARAGIGRQTTDWGWPPCGGTWTVWAHNHAHATGRVVPFDSQQSGDLILTRWGRTGDPVDHVDLAIGPRTLNLANVIGGNTSSGNASAGAGVYRAARTRSRVVTIFRPDWAALVATYNATTTPQEDELSTEAVREIKDHIDTLRRERTNAHTKEMGRFDDLEARLQRLEATQAEHTRQNNTIGRIAAEARELARSVPERVVAARVPFQDGTSLFKLFGKDFRLGALLGYSGAAYVDRDTHTEEIVDALADITIPEVGATDLDHQEEA